MTANGQEETFKETIPKVVIDQSVVFGLTNHCLCDASFPVMGYLAGTKIEKSNVFHISLFAPAKRLVKELVEECLCDDSKYLEKVEQDFKIKGLELVGIYHSPLEVNNYYTLKPSLKMENLFIAQVNLQGKEFNGISISFDKIPVTLSTREQNYASPQVLWKIQEIHSVFMLEYEEIKSAHDALAGPFKEHDYEHHVTQYLRHSILASRNFIEQEWLALESLKHHYKAQILNRCIELFHASGKESFESFIAPLHSFLKREIESADLFVDIFEDKHKLAPFVLSRKAPRVPFYRPPTYGYVDYYHQPSFMFPPAKESPPPDSLKYPSQVMNTIDNKL